MALQAVAGRKCHYRKVSGYIGSVFEPDEIGQLAHVLGKGATLGNYPSEDVTGVALLGQPFGCGRPDFAKCADRLAVLA